MKRHRIIAATLTLLLGSAVVPSAAGAVGPLLSGYGPPGAGAQTILGAGLVNGPGNGGGGGSTGGGAPTSATTSGSSSVSATSAAGLQGRSVTNRQGVAGGEHAGRGTRSGRGTSTSAHPGAAGANPNKSHLHASAVVDGADSSTAWFSIPDLMALVLASGVLALIALATIRLARTEHD